MIRNLILAIFMMSLFISPVVAQESISSEDFQMLENPTATDLARVENPTLGDFRKLVPDERSNYIRDNWNAVFANDYFSEILNMANVNLAQGSVSWDGANLRNGQFILKNVDSLKALGNILSMASTEDRIILTTSEAEVSAGGSNADYPFEIGKENGQMFMKINGARYPVPESAKVDIGFFGFSDAIITNKGNGNINLNLNEDLDSSLLRQRDTSATTILESIDLEPGGSVTISRTYALGQPDKQLKIPEYDIFNGRLTFSFERNMPAGESYGLKQVVESYFDQSIGAVKPVHVLIDEIGSNTDTLLRMYQNGGHEREVFLFHPSAWGSLEEKQGISGVNLEEAFRMRSGALAIGGGFNYLATETDKNGDISGGILYSPKIEDALRESQLNFRYGIEPETYVTESDGVKVETFNMPYSVVFPDGVERDVSELSKEQISEMLKQAEYSYFPFSASLTKFAVVDNDESKPLSDRISYQEVTWEVEERGPNLGISGSRRGLGESAELVNREVLNINDFVQRVYYEHPEELAKNAESIRNDALNSGGISISLGNAPYIEDGKLYRGQPWGTVFFTQEGEEKEQMYRIKVENLNVPNPKFGLGSEVPWLSLPEATILLPQEGPAIIQAKDFRLVEEGQVLELENTRLELSKNMLHIQSPVEGKAQITGRLSDGNPVAFTLFPGTIDLTRGDEQKIPIAIKDSVGSRILHDSNLYIVTAPNGDIGVEGILPAERSGAEARKALAPLIPISGPMYLASIAKDGAGIIQSGAEKAGEVLPPVVNLPAKIVDYVSSGFSKVFGLMSGDSPRQIKFSLVTGELVEEKLK